MNAVDIEWPWPAFQNVVDTEWPWPTFLHRWALRTIMDLLFIKCYLFRYLLFIFFFFSILIFLNLNAPHDFAYGIKNLSTIFAEKLLRGISTQGHIQRPSEAEYLVTPEYFCSVNVFVIPQFNSAPGLVWQSLNHQLMCVNPHTVTYIRSLCTSHLYPLPPLPPPTYGDGRRQRLSQNQSPAKTTALWGQMKSNSPAIFPHPMGDMKKEHLNVTGLILTRLFLVKGQLLQP